MVILASKRPLNKVEFPVLASIKFDGVRLYAIKRGKIVKLFTRSNKRVNIRSIEMALSNVPGNWFFDGEVTFQTGKQSERSTISGAVNHCLAKHANPGSDIEDVCFNVFDLMTHKEWATRTSVVAFENRLSTLREIHQYVYEHKSIKIAQHTVIENKEHADILFERMISKGYEGLILRYREDLYEFGRSKRVIKMKGEHECELEVVGFKPGTGKYSGQIGSLICEGIVKSTFVRVFVGSGMSDYDRSLDPSEYLGKIVDVLYNDVTKESLFLPRFLRVKGNYDV